MNLPQKTLVWLFLAGMAVNLAAAGSGAKLHSTTLSVCTTYTTWPETLLAIRRQLTAENIPQPERHRRLAETWNRARAEFPVEWDWIHQDAGPEFLSWFDREDNTTLERAMIRQVLNELGAGGRRLNSEFDGLCAADVPSRDLRWLRLYARACEKRRRRRLKPLLDRWRAIVFTRHYNLGGSHYAYTEGQSDAQHERTFVPGASLCLLEMRGLFGTARTLLRDPHGVIRDPDVSYDGRRILFAWKTSDREDDYHLYEMDAESGQMRQLTSGLGFADYEPAYLPDGDIIFNSTRCVQTVDCWWTEVSNLYRCDQDGKYLRRLTFDQVHDNYPTVADDGRVLYTRWEYSDRGQIFPQPLWQMNPDGTGQMAYYGNNSWFPTAILHARAIPGTRKVVAILSGHHTHQRGKLAVLDVRKGREEASGVQLIAPVRPTEAVRVDAYGQEGDQFQYPYPISETAFLVAYDPLGSANRAYSHTYGIYFMTADGRRELLVWDPAISCNQPVPLAPRPRPHLRPSMVDYRTTTGTYYVEDIYTGPGLEGVARGTVERLRVVALEYRAAGIGCNYNRGPGGRALASTPVSLGNGAWDVKVVLGDATVYADGSACFLVPARTPVYFQALDAKGHAVQTMRSWSTLQPGERFSCTGCHEHRNQSPPAGGRPSLAMQAGPRPLEPFYGPPRGFSFIKEIQPILDRHCIRCHKDRSEVPGLQGRQAAPASDAGEHAGEDRLAFSLLATQTAEPKSGRRWSDAYLALLQAHLDTGALAGRPHERVNWISAQSAPPILRPYHAGAARSRLLSMLEQGHEGVHLSREELDKIACWIDLLVPYCGTYTEANAWSPKEIDKYDRFLHKRRRMQAIERRNIEEWIAKQDTR